ncbi:putative mismatch repair protein MSH [Trypanosoma vivax]|uniref:Putative mismatch repair protein MSH n=1 Tax=Trypanosoma vivax (strain Y486) TaxID=1055687 RepID=G0TT98_TRYVY|nr:putative mismatch repair protein MSH [Trypanosoma vivax]CCC47179.1 putative mismatch repair protein MSH [Trypanosoma vivax Y486]
MSLYDSVGSDVVSCSPSVFVAVSVVLSYRCVGVAWYDDDSCQICCSEFVVSSESSMTCMVRCRADVPNDFLWLLQFFSSRNVCMLFVPSVGSQIVIDIAYLCGTEVVVCAPSIFDHSRVWHYLGTLWEDVTRVEWCSRINPQKLVMLMSLSALLHNLQRKGSSVADIAEVPPHGVLYIDDHTLSALQLVRSESHPMDFQGIGRSKEGLSLLAVVDRTCSPLGKSLLRQWFVTPVRDEEELRRRLDVVTFFTNSDSFELLSQLRRSLRQLRQPGPIFTKMRAGKHTRRDYESLFRTATGFLQIVYLLSPFAHQQSSFLRVVTSCQTSRLSEMRDIIDRAICLSKYSNETLNKTYVEVRPGYDMTLDELRAHCTHLDEVMTRVACEEALSLPPQCQPCTLFCVFAPQLGYVITISHDSVQTLDPESMPEWELLLTTEEGPLFKTPLTRRMDVELGDIRSAVLEREAEVRRHVDQRLLELSPALIPLCHCAELDCLTGFALCALEGQWSRPEIVQTPGVLVVDRGVHPILSRTTHQVVPYSIQIRTPAQRICVVTGANGSGKSIFITAIAHLVFLVHIGCYVPCGHAIVGLMDSFMSLHGSATHGSSSNHLGSLRELNSSFSSELVCMSRMLKCCSSRCKESADGASRVLLVLDEFGKGTLAADGAALLAASLRTITSLSDGCPIVLLATHYVEILHPYLLPLQKILVIEMLTAFGPTDCTLCQNTAETEEPVTDLDRLSDIGDLVHSYNAVPVGDEVGSENFASRRASSQALHFARQFSVPTVLLERAHEILLTDDI